MTTRNGLLIAVFVLLCGGTFALTTYAGKRAPARMIASVLADAEKHHSFFGAATVATFAPDEAVRAAGADPSTSPLAMVFVGQGGVNIPADALPSMTGSFTLVSGQDAKNDLAMDVRALADGTAYAMLTNVPSESTQGGDVAASLGIAEKTWRKMAGSELVATLRSIAGGTPDAPQADSPRDDAVTLAAWQRLRAAALSPDTFNDAVPKGAQVLADGTSAKVYALPVKRDALKAIAVDAATLIAGRRLTSIELLDVEQVAARRDGTLTLWIEPKQQKLLQASVDIRGVGLAPDANGLLPLVHASMLLRITGWDETVTVAAPTLTAPVAPTDDAVTP